MKKESKLVALSTALTLGGALLLPKIKGSSKQQLDRVKMEHIQQPGTLKDLRGKKYNEVFTAYRVFNKCIVGIYNNINRAPISVSEWGTFDTGRIKKETGAVEVMFNGPRFWVLDAIRGYYKGEEREFNGYQFDLVGTIEKKTSKFKAEAKQRKAYSETTIGRYTDWIYNKGEKVYELVSDDGTVYIMQSASLEIIKDQTIKNLESLSEKLKLPAGWMFRTRVLEDDLVYKIRGEAHVIQDDFRNSYQRVG